MTIEIPELSLVVLVGSSGCGKSTFCQKHFAPTQVISSDFCRGMLSDDLNDQSTTNEAFDLLHYILGKRLALGKSSVVDATNLRQEDRAEVVKLARRHHVLPFAIVFNVPEKVCWERTQNRPDRDMARRVIAAHCQLLRRSLRTIKKEGFSHIVVLNGVEEIERATVLFRKMWNDRCDDHGPFDIIGDVHGCYDELVELLEQLGYQKAENAYAHPQGRKAIFLGDLVDRGPKVIGVVNLVKAMTEAGTAFCVPGNHEKKLVGYLSGRKVEMTHGLPQSVAQFESLPERIRTAWKEQFLKWHRSLISHLRLDNGKLVVAHAGIKEAYQGRGSPQVSDFCLYGETTGEIDGYGLPVRLDWAADYRGRALVVYGHVPTEEPEFVNNTICIDQGCVFGGKLTALRYPERELASVPAKAQYYRPERPFGAQTEKQPDLRLTAQQRYDRYLNLQEITGKRFIRTRSLGSVLVSAEHSAAALEVFSRFCVDHRWLIYLPPTMSPCETATREGYLEYPDQAFEYYRKRGIPKVICEEKHMGSRALLILCKDTQAAVQRFGLPGVGQCYTRTGRRFFKNLALQEDLLVRLRDCLTSVGWWERFETDWCLIDCEIMPWNLKAGELLINQYELVATAGISAVQQMIDTLRLAQARGLPMDGMVETYERHLLALNRYQGAYQGYCWEVNGLRGVKVAPFHLLATEGHVYDDRDHEWHVASFAGLAAIDDLWKPTDLMTVELTSEESCKQAVQWWKERTERGAEGMVVKPFSFVAQSRGRLIQPAIKCRGREYLRIIYGPGYDEPETLERLRNRGLTHKRTLALQEFALGLEGLHRFVNNEPLRRTHECVIGVLAFESEPVDPRL
ncbi:MAG: polynucleotide kinase-phosphatase [Deltaproteobacteria bacterium]|nr:polynucleotide kinase-phosphatase [Deltaproteobacteria bacterium]